jgi:hypothetical protein
MPVSALLEPTAIRRVDDEARAEARDYLATLVGIDASVCWDPKHHLQGHAIVEGHELIVIAPRDAAHEPAVFTADDWDEIQHSPSERRVSLLRSRRITSHDGLLDVLTP